MRIGIVSFEFDCSAALIELWKKRTLQRQLDPMLFVGLALIYVTLNLQNA